MSSAWSAVRGFVPMSLCDWPGRTSCVLFTGGCSMRCPTCHNADLAWNPDLLPQVERHEFKTFAARRGGWLDGVVVSGGEPTERPELISLLRDLAGMGLPVKVDSNGMRPHVIEAVLDMGLAEAFHVDVKGPWRLYPQLTGNKISPEAAERNLARVFQLAADRPGAFRFRQTRVPMLSQAHVEETRGCLPPGFTLHEQAYVTPRRFYAPADSETGRMSRNLVAGPHRACHPEGPEGQRHQGPDSLQAACA